MRNTLTSTKTPFLVLSVLLLAACGQKVEGTYSNGVSKYIFKPNGNAVMQTLDIVTEVKYEVDGKAIKLIGPGGSIDLTLQDDGTITTKDGRRFSKVQN